MSVSIVIRSYRQQIDGISRKKIVKQRLRKLTPLRFSGAQEAKPKVSLRQHTANLCMISVIRSIFLAGSDKLKAKWGGLGCLIMGIKWRIGADS